MMAKPILVLGATGQVGWELARTLPILGPVIALPRAKADLAQPETLADIIAKADPCAIVNAAAYTQVDQAEDEPELAHKVNGEAVGVLAGEAARHGIPLVHYSTDYVFSGAAPTTPYTEEDETGPLGVYGQSKLAGEEAIRASGAAHLILRTAWVYAPRGKNFLRTMARLAVQRPELTVVGDQHGTPTSARLLAQVTTRALARAWDMAGRENWPDDLNGTYHVTASGQTTWHGFASLIVERLAARISGRSWPTVKAITTAEFPTKAPRPSWSVLDTARIQQTFRLALPPWEREVAACVDELCDVGAASREVGLG